MVHCNLNYVIEILEPLIIYLKKKAITTEIIDELIENIEGLGKNVLLLLITDIKNVINDRLKFIWSDVFGFQSYSSTR